MDIDDGIAYENELFAMCFATEDQKAGMKAFLDKRQKSMKKRFIQSQSPSQTANMALSKQVLSVFHVSWGVRELNAA